MAPLLLNLSRYFLLLRSRYRFCASLRLRHALMMLRDVATSDRLAPPTPRHGLIGARRAARGQISSPGDFD